jgi:tRNA nucleotidyltransferase (CCA-adding enzyme)
LQKYEKYEEIIGLFEQIRNEKVFSAAELEIDGNDILALGVRKGPMIGEVLEYLLEMVLKDPSINSRQELIKLAEQYIKAAETGGK